MNSNIVYNTVNVWYTNVALYNKKLKLDQGKNPWFIFSLKLFFYIFVFDF